MSNTQSWPNVYIDYGHTIIVEIGSACQFETLSSYEGTLEFYESNDFTYIPLIEDSKYYDRESESLRELHEDQWVIVDEPAIPMMERLEEHDFLLTFGEPPYFEVTDGGIKMVESVTKVAQGANTYSNPHNLLSEWPEYREEVNNALQEKGSTHIVTRADLNDRQVRAVLYRLISSVEVILSQVIKEAYPDDESLIKHMSVPGVGRWKKAEFEAGQLHAVEYMKFGRLKHIGSASSEVREKLGYSSRDEYEENLAGMTDLRNKVMHPTKNLIKNKKDLKELNDQIQRLEEFIERCGGEVDRQR